jgi:hypothetical protein
MVPPPREGDFTVNSVLAYVSANAKAAAKSAAKASK